MTTSEIAPTTRRKQVCRRCGGFVIREEDALACLLCGHRDYGRRFRPLGLDLAEARRSGVPYWPDTQSLPEDVSAEDEDAENEFTLEILEALS
jgi:hypothetical protein